MTLRSKPFFPVILVACIVLAAVILGGFVMRTQFVQKQLLESLSRSLGMEVQVASLSTGIFSSARLTNLVATNSQGDSLSAKSGKVRLRFWNLLSGHLVFREIALDGVRFVKVDRPKPPGSAPNAPAKSNEEATASQRARRAKALSSVRVIKLSNVSLDWQLSDGRTKLEVEGADFRLQLDSAGNGEGRLRLAKGTWMEMVRFTNLTANIAVQDRTVRINRIDAECGGGQLSGAAEGAMDPAHKFSLQLQASNVDLEAMTRELPSLRLGGAANGTVQVEGSLTDEESWTGHVKFHVEEGTFKSFAVLQMLGQALQIQELQHLAVKTADINGRIANRKISLDEMNINGGNILLTALGSVDFERRLSLNAKVSVQEKLLGGRLTQVLSRSFSPPDADGKRAISFQIGGTLEKPSTNILEKVATDGIGGVVNQLLEGFLKPRKTEPKPAQETVK